MGFGCRFHPELPSMGPSQVLIPKLKEPEVTQCRKAGVQLMVSGPLGLTLPRRGHQQSILYSEGKGCYRTIDTFIPLGPMTTVDSRDLHLGFLCFPERTFQQHHLLPDA